MLQSLDSSLQFVLFSLETSELVTAEPVFSDSIIEKPATSPLETEQYVDTKEEDIKGTKAKVQV